MIVNFTKMNSLLTFIVGIVITLVLKRYIYGLLIMLYSLFIIMQYSLLQVNDFKYHHITKIPAYVFLAIVIIISFYIMYKSKNIENIQKILAISQLSAAIVIIILIKVFNKFEIFKSYYINLLPAIFLYGFLLSVTMIEDNQIILSQLYTNTENKISNTISN